MAKVAGPQTKGPAVVAVLLPLWSFFLVKIYAWRRSLGEGGVLNWALDPIGLSSPGFGVTAVWLVESYLWLPYMILPIYAGLERIPNSLLSASEDLGAAPAHHLPAGGPAARSPAVVAGSIFTFSLTLGDYITPRWSRNTQFIGNVVYANIANNLPLASAFAAVPLLVMVLYLLIARRMGAFEHLSRASRGQRAPRVWASDHPRVHLHPADRDRDLRLQRRIDAQVAASRASPPSGSARRSTTRTPETPSSTRSRSGALATVIALVLGTLASFAVARSASSAARRSPSWW